MSDKKIYRILAICGSNLLIFFYAGILYEKVAIPQFPLLESSPLVIGLLFVYTCIFFMSKVIKSEYYLYILGFILNGWLVIVSLFLSINSYYKDSEIMFQTVKVDKVECAGGVKGYKAYPLAYFSFNEHPKYSPVKGINGCDNFDVIDSLVVSYQMGKLGYPIITKVVVKK